MDVGLQSGSSRLTEASADISACKTPIPASRLLTFAKTMRKQPTDAERVLWKIVRGKRLESFKFKRQQPLGSYIADIVCLGKRLIIEADGNHHADNHRDTLRDDWLRAEGFSVLRFWNHDILRDAPMVEETILRELRASESIGNPTTAWEIKR